MAFKIKQKWLQQFQEQQQDHLEKLRSSSSTFGGEGSTQHQAGPDTASRQRGVEQTARTAASHAPVDRQQQQQQDGQWAAGGKKRPPDTARPSQGSDAVPAKRKRDEDGAGLAAPAPRPASKLPSSRPQQEPLGPPPQQQAQPPVRPQPQQNGAGAAKPLKREPPGAAAAAAPDRGKQQQQHGKVKPEGGAGWKNEVASAGSNPSTSALTEQEGHQQEAASAQPPARPRVKQEGAGGVGGGVGPPPCRVPVEVEPRPSAKASLVGDLAVGSHGSYEELVAGLQSAFVDKLPKKAGMRLVYQDADGDWLLLLPDVPWQLFTSTVRRLLVTYK